MPIGQRLLFLLLYLPVRIVAIGGGLYLLLVVASNPEKTSELASRLGIVPNTQTLMLLIEAVQTFHKYQDHYKTLLLEIALFAGIALVGLAFVLLFLKKKTLHPALAVFVAIAHAALLFAFFHTGPLSVILGLAIYGAAIQGNREVKINLSAWDGLFLIPIFSEMLFPKRFLARLAGFSTDKESKWPTIFAVIITGNLMVSLVAFHFYMQDLPARQSERAARISDGDFLQVLIAPGSKKVYACKKSSSQLYRLDLLDLSKPPSHFSLDTVELEDVAINEERNELYHFSRGDNLMKVYDLDSLELVRQSPAPIEGKGSAKQTFDNKSQTLAFVREAGLYVLLDLNNLEVLQRIPININTQDFIFDPFAGKYLLSLTNSLNVFFAIAPGENKFEEILAGEKQQHFAISKKRRELYLAMPFDKQILVFDAKTLKPKRSIPAHWSVRTIAVDDEHDLLAAGSLLSGQLVIYDLDTSQKVDEFFAQYYTRHMALDSASRTGFFTSKFGLYRFSY